MGIDVRWAKSNPERNAGGRGRGIGVCVRLPMAIVHQSTGRCLLTLVCLQHRLGRQDEKGDHEEEQQLQGEAEGKLAHVG